MKKNVAILLLLSALALVFCKAQTKSQQQIKVYSVIDSTNCINYEQKCIYALPDIFGKNEKNFFNNIIIQDFLNYLDVDTIPLNPKEAITVAISNRNKECANLNFNGLIGSSYNISFNNSSLLSMTINYQSLAGNLNSESYHYNFDIDHKKVLNIYDILKKEEFGNLMVRINSTLNRRLKNLYKQNSSELKNSEAYSKLINSKQLFSKANLGSFLITNKGILFDYDYGFKRGDFDIENHYFLSFKEMSYFKEKFLTELKAASPVN